MPETGSRTSLAATLAVSLLAPAAVFADPVRNGQPQVMKAHRPPHFVPPSLSPAATLHPAAAAGLAKVYSGTPIDVTTYHYDSLRTGWNPRETDLTTTTVASANFGLLTTLNVDGNVFSQPLLVSSFVMPDGSTHNVLIIATGHNSVYAYDAQTYALLWHINLGPSQSSADVGCGDVEPEYGISSTPVIVRSAANAATFYLVSATEPQSFTFETHVHAPGDLDAWKQDAIAGLGEPRAAHATEARQDRRRLKELERELNRKDKALAETAALLVLSKKLSAVFHSGADA